MENVNKRIDELIEIANAATPGPYHIGHIDEFLPNLMDVENIEGVIVAEDIDGKNARYFCAFHPSFVLKLLQSWREMRIALEYINQDEWPGEALPVENDDGEINYSNLIDYYGKLTSEVLDKADEVFE